MKPTLTRDELEDFLASADSLEAKGVDVLFSRELCRGYLAYLDMVPVKLKDLPEGCEFVIAYASDGSAGTFLRKYPKSGRWMSHILGEPWPVDAYAIPVKALPTPEGET